MAKTVDRDVHDVSESVHRGTFVFLHLEAVGRWPKTCCISFKTSEDLPCARLLTTLLLWHAVVDVGGLSLQWRHFRLMTHD